MNLPIRTARLALLAGCLCPGGLVTANPDPSVQISESHVPGGDVFAFQVSEDGSQVVYLADHEMRFVTELYSAPLSTGGPPAKLNGPLGLREDVFDFRISEDGSTVVYRASQDASQIVELYSVPIGGGMPIKLNSPLVLGGDVQEFQISEDGQYVVYRADQDSDQTFELYSVPILGGNVEKLNLFLPLGHDVLPDFQINESGTLVVYRADQDVDNRVELYSVPIVGGLPVKLNRSLPVGGDVIDFRISDHPEILPSETWVVYRADGTSDQVFELYSVPLEGGSVAKLNGPLALGGNVVDFEIDPDCGHEQGSENLRVVYLADQEANQVFDLYSVAIVGGQAIKLNEPLVPGGDVLEFKVTAFAGQVVFRADQHVDGQVELLSVPIEGGGTVTLNDGLALAGDVVGFELSPDPTAEHIRAVYVADQDINEVFELYSTPVLGGEVEKLNTQLVSGGDVAEFEASPDGRRVAYVADQDTNGVAELYLVPIEGGEVQSLNCPLTGGGDVLEFLFSPDGGRVLYLANQETIGSIDLYGWVTGSPETYPEFVAVHGLSGDPKEDEDGDGLVNAFEYLTGRDPLASDFGGQLLKIESTDGNVHISFPVVAAPVGSDLVIELQTSTTLHSGDWETVARRAGMEPWSGSVPITLSSDGPGLERVTATESTHGEPARFYRLEVRLTPINTDCPH